MGWYTCYQELKCYKAHAKEQLPEEAIRRADATNIRAERERAWEYAEMKVEQERADLRESLSRSMNMNCY